jgi:hypothetical protein
MFINNLNNNSTEITELISPSYDFSIPNNYSLKYKYAHAQQLSGGNDRLIVYYTTNCGGSWSILKVKLSSALASAPKTNNFFIPNSSQWKEEIIDVSALSLFNNVKFKFYYKNIGGNNFWLDDINIDITTSLNELNDVLNYTIYPNPTTESAMVNFSLSKNVEELSLTIKDVTGKTISSVVKNQTFNAGKYTLSIDQTKQLSAGLYLLEFKLDNKIVVEKLIIN